MRRRQVLASGTALLVAGCVGQDEPPDSSPGTQQPTDTEAATSTPTATQGARTTMTILDERVQPGVVAMNSPDSVAVHGDGGQFLLMQVEVTDGPAPQYSDLSFLVAGERHEPERYRLFKNEDLGALYEFDKGKGWVVFELPEQVEASEPKFGWPDGTVTLLPRTRTRLETPSPPFDVTFEAPPTVTEDDSPTLSLSVHNRGEVAGTCVLGLNRVGPRIAYTPVREITVDLDAGESMTREYPAKSPYEPAGEPNSVTYHLELLGGERISRTIEPAE
ncbi:hypothetical protein [Haloparvum sp. PAK95]|uniref:hypothetical protein n=1 Tax=Haloparvum sp. PAK95 TaxID=3418962 RepID=UPI003D2E9D7E